MARRVNRIGLRLGRLTVVEDTGKRSSGKNIIWRCLCSCGNYTEVCSSNLKKGNITSCGCYSLELKTKHGFAARRGEYRGEYLIYRAMINRCFNEKNPYYSQYGGRGITVCEDWSSFDNFIRDMGRRPSGYQLDRIDNNLGYSKNNCRWATPRQNTNNRNVTKRVEYMGKLEPLSELCEKLGLDYDRTYGRIYLLNWPIDRALKND